MRIKQVEDDFRMAFRNLLEDQMRSLHSIPIANDVAEMVGIAPDEAGGAPAAPVQPAAPQPAGPQAAGPAPAAPAAPAPPASAPAAPTPAAPATPAEDGATYAEAVAAAGAPPVEGTGGAARPRAQVARREPEVAEPGEATPPAAGSVQSVQLGELGSPDLGPEPPTYSEPPEFTPGRFGAGEREEDLDIEEID